MKDQTFVIGHTQPRAANDLPLLHAEASAAVRMDIPTLLDTRMIVCANSGGGKSYLYRLIAERAGQSATSSGYQNNLGALRSLGLLDYPRTGFVVATTLLFPDGLR